MITMSRTFMALALATAAFALTPKSAVAQSFTGNYPVAVTQLKDGNIKFGNQSYCLELTDNGGAGRTHSGNATLDSSNSSPLTGTFQIIGQTIVVMFTVGSDTGEASSVIFAAPANTSTEAIGVGIYDSANEVTGLATFGEKNGC